MQFFLYGTLMTGAGTRMACWIAERLADSRPASVPGRIVALRTATGWYPALIPGRGGERVRGMLVRLVLRPGDLARLDRYEGREYRRVTVRARLDGGGCTAAQAYRWQLPVPSDARPVRGGDFLGWLERTGNRPFTERRNGV